MLSRIASNLFWMGRYLERAEHMARYMKVQYFSSLDAPATQKMEYVLESILDMSGSDEDYYVKYQHLSDDDVLAFVGLERNNPNSIASCVHYARENARGAIDTLSAEIWESINRYYHTLLSTDETHYRVSGLYEFCNMTEDNSSIVSGYINSTLLQNDAWSFINMGMHLERATQINRMIISKLMDVGKTHNEAIVNYQWSTLLKSCESFDMYHRYFRSAPIKRNTLEFLVLMPAFPKTVYFNLCEAYRQLRLLNRFREEKKGTPEYALGKLVAQLKYMEPQELEANANDFLNELLAKVYKISVDVENQFFK